MSCVTLEKSLNLYEPQSSHLFSYDDDDDDDDDTQLVKLFWGLNEKRYPVSDPGGLIYLWHVNVAVGQQ